MNMEFVSIFIWLPPLSCAFTLIPTSFFSTPMALYRDLLWVVAKLDGFRRIGGKLKEIGTILWKILFCLFSPSKQWFREHGSGGNEKCENGGMKGWRDFFSRKKDWSCLKGNFGHCQCDSKSTIPEGRSKIQDLVSSIRHLKSKQNLNNDFSEHQCTVG